MASVLPNPTKLSIATRLPPQHTRTFSRSKSPERSPARKAQFTARELDPLLQNLSPDSTLEALQKTNTIAGSQEEQSALARSIADASESERKLGIRAAIAAKNLREWTEEVTAWPWPAREDRSWGAGFIPPTTDDKSNTSHCGSLPETTVKQYEDRLDEIWDAIETLGMDDLKDYVFSFHNPTKASAEGPKSYPSSYGRMRDFTALITATVIQSLPVQAHLLILLDTWSIRLSVLREVPDLMSRFDRVRLALNEINDIIQNPTISCRLTRSELETAKVMFGNKVSQLGKCVDNLLDQLEGQEDSLPQAWLDSLDDIENKYAAWVSQAEQVVLKNQMSNSRPRTATNGHSPAPLPIFASFPVPSQTHSRGVDSAESSMSAVTPTSPSRTTNAVKRKPLLEVTPNNVDSKHRRGVSEVSVADSTFSGYSLENAEIIDAVETKVMPSPRISVIDHQSPDKTSVPWMKGITNMNLSPPRPTVLLQRASTASIEIIPKNHVKEVTLRRSASHDLLSGSRKSSRSPLHTMLPAPVLAAQNQPSTTRASTLPDSLTPLATSPSPSLRVDPLSLRGKDLANNALDSRPIVPRRSSKRLSMPLLESYRQPLIAPEAEGGKDTVAIVNDTPSTPAAAPTITSHEETFDDRLKTILASMPTKIRLADGSDSGRSSGTASESSSRASSPVQGLRLCPVKDVKSGRLQSISGIRVYNLSKSGKSRDAAPIKLFVRAVGEHGERVMVRVGGGWADLAEYLREYSLHHGGRSLMEGRVEVANYPGAGSVKTPQRDNPSVRPLSSHSKDQPNFDFGLSEQNTIKRVESNPSSTSFDSTEANQSSKSRPPPIPLIPSGHATTPNARSTTPRSQNASRSSTPANLSRPTSRISVHTSTTPVVTTTMSSSNNYTPLGAAGPVHNSRRASSYTYSLTPPNNSRINGTMNSARAVSGSHTHHPYIPGTTTPITHRHSTIITSPTTTVTTTMSSRRTPNTGNTSRKISSINTSTTPTPAPISPPTPVSAPIASTKPTVNNATRPVVQSSPIGSELSQPSSGSSGSHTTLSRTKDGDADGRRKSVLNFGNVGGIRRVFLRKKSDRSDKSTP